MGSNGELRRDLFRRLSRGSGWGAAARIGSLVVGFLMTVLLTHLLAPAEYGAYAVAVRVASFGGLLVALGLDQQVLGEVGIASANDDAKARHVSVLTAYVILSISALSVVVLWTVGGLGRRLLKNVIQAPALAELSAILIGWAVLSGPVRLNQSVFRASDRLSKSVVFGPEGARLLTLVLLSGTVLLARPPDLMAVLFIIGSCYLFIAVGGFIALPHNNASSVVASNRPLWSDCPAMIRRSLPLLGFALLTFARTEADIWFLSAFQAEDQVGRYAVAWKLARLVILPLAIAAWGIPPLVAEAYAKDDREKMEKITATVARWASTVAIAIVLLLFMFGGDLLGMFFGEFYRGAYPILLVLSLGLLADVVVGPATTTLVVTNNGQALLWMTAITSGMAVVLYTVGAARGVHALSIAVAFCGATQALLTWFATKKVVGVNTRARVPFLG